jgi:alpha-1,6-mannosyltransferase
MRIVDVTSFFAETCGGIRTYYQEKARHLPRLGLECHFVVPDSVGRRDAVSEPLADATLHRLPGIPMLGSRFYRRFDGVAPLRRLLARLRPDVIELGSHYVLPDLVRAALWGLDLRPALVGFYHADFPRTYVAPAFARLPRVGRTAVRAAWSLVTRQHRRYRATMAASRHVAVALAEHGVPDVRWVGLGVDTATFRPRRAAPRAQPRMVYAGRLASEKGFALLLEAAPAIRAATGAEIVIAGDGPLADRIPGDFLRTGLRAIGTVRDREAMAALLADCDAVIVPGQHETFSLAAAEAMACGTPVVGANRGGNGELVAGAGTGLWFRAGSADDLARATIALLRMPPAVRAELGERGRRHVDALYGWDHVALRIADVYAEVLHP